MPYNGTGTWAAAGSTFNPAVNATTISSTDWNTLLADISTALSTCVLKDGTQTLTANIPMGGFKLTGLGAGTGTGNSLRYEQLFNASGITLIGNLLFTDATFDIGQSGATRPRDGFFSRNLVVGGTANVTGHVTLEGVTSTGATGTGKLVFDTSPTVALASASTGTTQTAGDASTKLATTAYVDRGSSGASWILVDTKTGSGASSLDFTSGIDSSADVWKIEVVNLIPGTNATNLLLEVSENAGGAWKTGASDYSYYGNSFNNAGVANGLNSTGATFILLTAVTLSNTVDGWNGTITFWIPSGTTYRKDFMFDGCYVDSAGPNRTRVFGGGTYIGTTNAINGIRLIMGAGTLSGTAYLYKARKA